jgi:hypothetical protein
MPTHHILDEPEPPLVPDHVQRRRATRFFWYALGLSALIALQFFLLFRSLSQHALPGERMLSINYVFLIGVAGVWLFTGMGLVASIRVLRSGKMDLVLALILILHGALFVVSSAYLLKSIHWLQVF